MRTPNCIRSERLEDENSRC